MECREVIKTLNMNKDEWLEYRRRGIGGSDIAAICGLNKYKTAFDVYLDKIGKGKEYQESEAAYFGTLFEEAVAKEFSKRSGKKVRNKNSILAHKDFDFMFANVDRLIVGEKAGLECKTASEYVKSKWSDDNIPMDYMLQCQWYMAVTGYKKWYIAVIIGGNKFEYKEIDRDEDIIENIISIAKDFWENHVLKHIPPSLDGSEAADETLKQLYPNAISNSVLQLDKDIIPKIERIKELKEKIKELTEEVKTHENQIKDVLKDNEIGVIEDYQVTWKNQVRASFDSKGFKTEYPDIYNSFVKKTSFRKFEIK